MKIINIEQIKELYYNQDRSLLDVASKLNYKSSTTISNILKKHNLPLKKQGQSTHNRKCKIDLSYFESIDSPNKAYILGLIISDGYINNSGKITFTSTDLDLINTYRNELRSSHKLSEYFFYDKRTNKTYHKYSIQICSKKMVADLKKLGVYQAKSFSCDLPNINPNLFWHLLRGIFDGDGSILKIKKEGNLRFKLIGSKVMLEKIKIKFDELNMNNVSICDTKYMNNSGVISVLSYSSFKDLSLIYKLMYNDSDGIRLKRKYDIFKTLKQYKRGSYDRTKNLKNVIMYDLNGKFIKEFTNIHEASKEINSTYSMINRVINGKRNHTKGYKFQYKN